MMHLDDQENMSFMTGRRIYCYKVMPFRLKNARVTYQWLVNYMFKDQIGKTMEVYIDDMLKIQKRQKITLITSDKPLMYRKITKCGSALLSAVWSLG